MTPSSRLTLIALAIFFVAAAPASAQSQAVQVQLAPGTFVYVGGAAANGDWPFEESHGTFGSCVEGEWTGAHLSKDFPDQPAGCPNDPAAQKVEVPSGDPGALDALVAQVQALVEGGGGVDPGSGGPDPGAGGPDPGAGDPGTPSQRECSGVTGPGATCSGTATDYTLAKPPTSEGGGEFGICTTQDAQPEGPGYYYGTSDGDGGHNPTCPGAGTATTGEGGTTPPPADQDGDGVPDERDRCPTTAGTTSDGCSAPEQSGGGTDGTDGNDGNDGADGIDGADGTDGTGGTDGGGTGGGGTDRQPGSSGPRRAPDSSRGGRCDSLKATVTGTRRSDGRKLLGTARRDVIAALGGNDRVGGKRRADVLCGGRGADVLRGGRGDDRIHGGPGADRLFGERGNDTLIGGPGNDRIYSVAGFRDRVVCGRGRDVVHAGLADKVSRSCERVRRS